MAKNYNANKFKYFVLIDAVAAKGGSVSFRTYTDNAGVFGSPGKGVMYVEGIDEKGRPRGKFFELSQSRRSFVVREGQVDIETKSMYDFLKNSPDCEGSPNAPANHKPLFKEMNQAKDAKVANESGKFRAKALAKVYELDEAKDIEVLEALGAHIGYFEEYDDMLLHKVAEWAEKRPEDFFEILNSADLQVRAMVRKAIAKSILTKRGPVISWEGTLIGADEDGAVAKLIDDSAMRSALETKLGIEVKLKTAAKKNAK